MIDDKPTRVLLIDDDEDDYVLTRDLLDEPNGGGRFNIEWSEDYDSALEAIRNRAHDVYLIDYRLGARNGLELLRGAFACGCKAPMILLTGQGDHEVDVAAMSAGAADYLIKGQISASLLKRSIRHAINRAHTLEALRESEERYRDLVENAKDIIYTHDLEGRFTSVNKAGQQLTGYACDEVGQLSIKQIVAPEYAEQVQQMIAQKVAEGGTTTYEMEIVTKDGERIALEVSTRLIFQNGGISGVQGIGRDITERKRAEERLFRDAFYDGLTGLPNRALFMDHLHQVVERAEQNEDYQFAVLFLDFDRFKLINDSLGHVVGDKLLVALAHRLEHSLRPGDTVARLGGDEFTILLDKIASAADAVIITERIQKELTAPFSIVGHEVFTTASIGIALSATGYERPEDLLRDADTAMYRAKARGKARYEVFDKEMHASAVTLLQIETDLRRAVNRAEFRLHYQPIVSLATGKIHGFEALVRWQHPEHGLIYPDKFIDIAEETGLIRPMGLWVLREACRRMHEWQIECCFDGPLTIHVNISGKQFGQPDLVDQISRILDETRLDPQSLKLEMTESVVMDDVVTTATMLEQLQMLNVGLSIDDFGTGYSSLSYLHRFPFNTLKIDRSFTSRIGVNPEDTEIVRTIIMLAHSLGMNVVAEGVETEAQLACLVALECTYGQGYYFSRPVDEAAAQALIMENPRWPVRRAEKRLVAKQPPNSIASFPSLAGSPI